METLDWNPEILLKNLQKITNEEGLKSWKLFFLCRGRKRTAVTNACSWVSREHWAQCKGSAMDPSWAHTWKQLNAIDHPPKMCPVWARRSLDTCLSGMFQLQRFTENGRASKDREHYSGWAVPYSLCYHIQLNSTKIRVTNPGSGPYFPLWKRQLLKFPVIRYSLQWLKPNTPRDPTMALAWLRHQIIHQKNAKQITLGWSWHTHTKSEK